MELSDQVAEENVLGLIMTAPKEVVADIFSRITVDDLYYDGYRQFFTLLRNCYINGEETTIFAITNLHQSEFERIAKLCKTSPIALGTGHGNINYSSAMLGKSEDVIGILADRLAEKRRMRNLHDIETRIAKGLDKKESTWETFEAVEKMLMEKNVSSDKRSYLSPNDMANLMVESVSERMDKKKRNKEIIYTSYEQFNRRSGGLENGNLVILSAGSGVGKSALAINLVRDVAYVSNKPVLYLNSEMTDKQQARRYASLLSKVSHKAIRNGDVTDEQFNKIFKVANDFRTKQIHTITIPDMQLSHVIAEIKRMKTRADIALAVVDYVGRMDITKTFKKDMQEWQIMEQTARELKNLALELDIVIIMVAQLSSNGQTLAKGSSMKNECDLWINLKRVGNEDLKEYYDTHGEGLDKWWNVILDFKKARSAEFGAKIPMHFYGDELLFTDDEEEAKHFLALEQNNVAHNRD